MKRFPSNIESPQNIAPQVFMPSFLVDHMDLVSAELFKVVVALLRLEGCETPFGFKVDRPLLKRITGLTYEQLDKAIAEGVAMGVITVRPSTVSFGHTEPYERISLYGTFHNFFENRAPKFTLYEFLLQYDDGHESRPGYIYILHNGAGFYKIGLTANPPQRLRYYDTHSPLELEVIALYHVGYMHNCEFALHELFKKQRTRGEWFQLLECQVEWLRATTYEYDPNRYSLD